MVGKIILESVSYSITFTSRQGMRIFYGIRSHPVILRKPKGKYHRLACFLPLFTSIFSSSLALSPSSSPSLSVSFFPSPSFGLFLSFCLYLYLDLSRSVFMSTSISNSNYISISTSISISISGFFLSHSLSPPSLQV